MNRKLVVLVAIGLASTTARAWDKHGDREGRFGRLDHVFFIMMENQTDTDILGNPNAPFINAYAKTANRASNYYAVGHPSAPNYLEVIGGSNFGVSNDFWPNWVTLGCIDNAPNSTGCENAVTPIAVGGLDNAVVATATNDSQCNGQLTITGTPAPNNCALYDYPSTYFTPKSIADQLVETGRRWKTYQESLPSVEPGVFGINYSDGNYSSMSSTSVFAPGPIQKLYAVKHDPFVYFRNIEVGDNPELSLERVQDFDGDRGLWADLQREIPALAFIVPNQCHDMHGFVSGGTPICSTNTQAETNLTILQGDAEVEKLIKGIKSSRAWKEGRNVIVVTWDENDYSNATNRVVLLVETNYASNGRVDDTPYDHYSLLRTLEAGFGLPCLNHACDQTSKVMNVIFGGDDD